MPQTGPIESLHQMIAKYGHAVIGVGTGMPCMFCEAGDPLSSHKHTELEVPFCYTVGLSKDKYPELILFGIEPFSSQRLLNKLAAMMKQREQTFHHNEMIDLGGKHPILAVAAEKPETWTEYVTWPKRLLGVEKCAVIQLIACDLHGHFPPDCEPPYSRVPILTNDSLPANT